MKKLNYCCCIILGLLFIGAGESHAQNVTKDDVRLFQSYFRDAPIAASPYVEGLAEYSNVPLGSELRTGVQGGISVLRDVEVTTGVYYVNFNPDNFSNESGIMDIPVYGRYSFLNEETKISGGAYVTLPTGSEALGQENTDFGIFGAIRHPASEEVVVTGTLGIDFLETGLEREASLNLGAGVIYTTSEKMNVVGELRIQSDIDYSALSGGLDYRLNNLGRLRANLLLGLDDGAPDYGLSGSFLIIF